jgi:hypothetical protein
VIAAAGAWLIHKFWWMLRGNGERTRLHASFMDINRYALALMAAVMFDGLFGL